MNCQELENYARTVRKAIELAVKKGEIIEMKLFPCGCCGFASDILQRFLYEKGIETLSLSGKIIDSPEKSRSHIWLETKEGIVIDITGDQFKYDTICPFDKPVYVGERNDSFHDKFETDKGYCYSLESNLFANPFDINTKEEKRYETVMKYIT